jgi:FAD:protein FMN transferase
MGAMASMTLVHPDREAGSGSSSAASPRSLGWKRSSASTARLGPGAPQQGGVLDHPPLELVEVLSFAAALARQSDGAFDATVQPLFELYARHFVRPMPIPAGRRRRASPRR